MKTLLFVLAISIIAIACETDNSTDVEKFIPGIYVCNFSDSISATANVKGVDSIVIKKETETGSDTYEIKRFNTFRRMMDSVLQPEKHENETWTGIYEKESKVLKTSSGKILAFDTENHLLKIDDKVYKKRE